MSASRTRSLARRAQSQHLCHERQSRKRDEGISNSYPRSLSVKTHPLAATGVDSNIWNLQNFFSTLRLTAQLLGLGKKVVLIRRVLACVGSSGKLPEQNALLAPQQAARKRCHQIRSTEKFVTISGRRLSPSAQTSGAAPRSVFDLKRRALLGSPPSSVIHPGGGNIRVSQPFLHLGDIRPMG
jgi:hypothetical protein